MDGNANLVLKRPQPVIPGKKSASLWVDELQYVNGKRLKGQHCNLQYIAQSSKEVNKDKKM